MYFVLLLFPTYHYTGVILFAVGIFLDILDGIVARKMKQSKEYSYKPVEDLDTFIFHLYFLLLTLATLLGMHLDSLVDK